MLYVLILAVTLSIVVSACCSLMEASLYAVPLPYVKNLSESGRISGRKLMQLKQNIQRPISAILILNTIANTAGAAVAGWAWGQLYGDTLGEWGLVVFSGSFIIAILFFSEIIPKIVGVVYSKKVAPAAAVPLAVLVALLAYPVKVAEAVSSYLHPVKNAPAVSAEEVLSMAALGTEEGALDHFEGSVITNVIGLDQLLVRDVLTPRVVVFRALETTKLGDLQDVIGKWAHSRVPLYAEEDPDNLTGYVTQRDIYRELIKGNVDLELKELKRSLDIVPELMRVDKLLLHMFEKREHVCAVVDEYGGLAGIITLEDIIEEVVGREIVDEYDTVSDLRTFAKLLRVARSRKANQKKK